jgi:hypothetical protein
MPTKKEKALKLMQARQVGWAQFSDQHFSPNSPGWHDLALTAEKNSSENMDVDHLRASIAKMDADLYTDGEYLASRILGGDFTSGSVEAKTLALAKKRETGSHRDNKFIYTRGFQYPVESEQIRWQHTREIIKRVEPGMYENPAYLESLARQTASIEMTLRGELDGSLNERIAKVTERVLLASVPEPFVNASSESEKACIQSDYVLVFISYGLIQVLYQMARAVVLSWKPKTPPPGSASCFSSLQEDTEAVLAKNPYPVDLLLETLKSFLFEGVPRDPAPMPLKLHYALPLSMLVALSERYVIAHEYGHALFHHPLGKDLGIPSLPEEKAWDKEYLADAFAFFVVLASAEHLDLFPDTMALEGPLFALQVIDVLREATDVIRSGMVMADRGFDTHPPTRLRMEVIKALYRKICCQDDGDYQMMKGALLPGETLLLLWKYALPKLAACKGSAKLHPIWGDALSHSTAQRG